MLNTRSISEYRNKLRIFEIVVLGGETEINLRSLFWAKTKKDFNKDHSSSLNWYIINMNYLAKTCTNLIFLIREDLNESSVVSSILLDI